MTGRYALPLVWRRPLAWLVLIWAWLFLIFHRDWSAMLDQWWNSSTYNHILLIPAILCWLVWMRAGQLARLVPRGWWPGLIAVAGVTLIWLLGDFSGISLLRQAGAVGLLVATAMAMLGPRVASGLAFPLLYMVFLVPFGDELVPPLQMITAFLTVGLVHLSGIPAVIDGVFIQTPAGLFEVAEACSGVKFLIAMIAFGVLAAHVCFRSWLRRIGFVALCVAVPILANGVRAWGTIYMAQYVGAEKASGFDHIVYGWIFFGLVIAMVIGLGWRYFDRSVDDPMIDADRIAGSRLLARIAGRPWPIARVGGGVLLIALVAMGWSQTADKLAAPVPRQLHLPQVAGWQRADYRPLASWQPRARGAEHRLLGRYRDAQGRTVDVFYALYAGQGEGREAGGFGEGALPEGGLWSWSGPGGYLPPGRSDRLLSELETPRLAITFYRTGSLTTGSNLRLRLANMADRLLLRARPTAMLIVSSESGDSGQAEEAVRAFLRAAGPVSEWMDRIGSGR